MDIKNLISTSAAYIRERMGERTPDTLIILGSGLGDIADLIVDPLVIPYGEIPGFPVSTAIGHKGNFIIGTFGGHQVMAMQGRFHYYEGYPIEMVTLPVRVAASLGIKRLFVSNAAGGVRPGMTVGELMVIKDHINMIPNALIGPNLDEFGPRFPDMTEAYDMRLVKRAVEIAESIGVKTIPGVYIALTGPCYETPAEYRFVRIIGADAVGMSTTPEVIVARHCGMTVFGMSVITDVYREGAEDNGTDEQEVIKAAKAASEKMVAIFRMMLEEL